MAGFCTRGTLAVPEERGPKTPTGTAWLAGARPKVFLLNWIMKPSSGCAVSFWNRSWYTVSHRESV